MSDERASTAAAAERARPSRCGSSPRATAASSACSTARTSCLTLAGAVRIAQFTEMSRATVDGPYDVSLVEGSITTADDAERIQEVRAASRRWSRSAPARPPAASRGSATSPPSASTPRPSTPTPSTSTPWRPPRRSPHTSPVDFELHGCPIDRHQLLEVITAAPGRSRPVIPGHRVCEECKGRGTVCLLVAEGTPCLGPVTRAGCGALCPAVGRGCFGCFGPADTANTASLAGRLRAEGMAPVDVSACSAPSTPAPGLPDESVAQEASRSPSAAPPQVGRGTDEPRLSRSRTIGVEGLARVEGEGSLRVEVRDGVVTDVALEIFEPPRFFEALLVGRRLHRGPRHHRPHLRHLPGRLPDERVRGHRGRLRGRSSTSGSRRCAGCSTAASGSRATPSTSTSCTRPTSSAAPTRSSSPSATGRGRARPRAQAHRQPGHGDRRRTGHPPGQRPGRRLLPGPVSRRDRGAWPSRLRRARDARAGHGRVGRRLRLPRRRGATTASWRCASRTATRSRPGRSRPPTASISSPAELRRPGRRGARGPLDRAARPARRTRRLPHRPARPLRAQPGRAARRSPAEAAAGAGLGPGVHQPVPEHRRAGRRARVRLRRGAAAGRVLRAARPRRRRRDRRAPASGTGATEAPRGLLLHRYELDADGTIRRGSHRAARPRRTSSPSRRTCAGWSRRPRPRRRRAAAGDASRRCATTTRASRAPRTSSTSRWCPDDRPPGPSAAGPSGGGSWWPAWGTSTGATTAPGPRVGRRCAPARAPAWSTSGPSAEPSTCSGGGTAPTSPSSSMPSARAPPGHRPGRRPRRRRAATDDRATSTHGIGLRGVLRLAQAVGDAPAAGGRGRHRRGRLRPGNGPEPRRRAGVEGAARTVLELIRAVTSCA